MLATTKIALGNRVVRTARGVALALVLSCGAALPGAQVNGGAAAAQPRPTGDETLDRARAALARGEQARAEKLLSSPHRNGAAASLLGTILLGAGRTAEALAVLEEACRKLPGDPYPMGLKSTALSELGRPQEALAAAEEARKLDPRGLDALRLLSELHARAKRYRELVGVSEEIIRRDPKDPVAPFRAALGEAGQGRFGQARRWALQAAQLAPSEPRVWLLLGRIEERLGKRADAKKRYERAQAEGLSAADLMEAELGRGPGRREDGK